MRTDPQIEAVLASYVSSTIYSEAEAKIRATAAARASHSTQDSRMAAFGKYAATRLIRSIGIGDLKGVLGQFDEECKNYFDKKITHVQQSNWDSLIKARHAVAHESGSQVSTVTLGDITTYYGSVKEVILLFEESLHV